MSDGVDRWFKKHARKKVPVTSDIITRLTVNGVLKYSLTKGDS
jgi:hypothetical protein